MPVTAQSVLHAGRPATVSPGGDMEKSRRLAVRSKAPGPADEGPGDDPADPPFVAERPGPQAHLVELGAGG